jgi:regulator of protease activity HflC (stomatin/prohibitin superfamily)
MKRIFLLIVVVCSILLSGCGDVVPPGTIVLVLDTDGNSTKHTSGVYKAWGRDRAYLIDTKLKSFPERLKILCSDKINMDVDVKWVGSFSLDSKENIKVIKEKVTASKAADSKIYTLSLESFYRTAISDIVRSVSRTVVSPYTTDVIADQRKEIEAAIRKGVIDKLTALNYPVTTTDVLLSNLDYPEEVTAQRKAIKNAQLDDEKRAAEAKAAVAQAKRDSELAMEKGKAEVVAAQAKAKANRILSDSITPAILAMAQWDAFKEAAKGPNNETYFIPYEAIKPTDIITPASVKKLRK